MILYDCDWVKKLPHGSLLWKYPQCGFKSPNVFNSSQTLGEILKITFLFYALGNFHFLKKTKTILKNYYNIHTYIDIDICWNYVLLNAMALIAHIAIVLARPPNWCLCAITFLIAIVAFFQYYLKSFFLDALWKESFWRSWSSQVISDYHKLLKHDYFIV